MRDDTPAGIGLAGMIGNAAISSLGQVIGEALAQRHNKNLPPPPEVVTKETALKLCKDVGDFWLQHVKKTDAAWREAYSGMLDKYAKSTARLRFIESFLPGEFAPESNLESIEEFGVNAFRSHIDRAIADTTDKSKLFDGKFLTAGTLSAMSKSKDEYLASYDYVEQSIRDEIERRVDTSEKLIPESSLAPVVDEFGKSVQRVEQLQRQLEQKSRALNDLRESNADLARRIREHFAPRCDRIKAALQEVFDGYAAGNESLRDQVHALRAALAGLDPRHPLLGGMRRGRLVVNDGHVTWQESERYEDSPEHDHLSERASVDQFRQYVMAMIDDAYACRGLLYSLDGIADDGFNLAVFDERAMADDLMDTATEAVEMSVEPFDQVAAEAATLTLVDASGAGPSPEDLLADGGDDVDGGEQGADDTDQKI